MSTITTLARHLNLSELMGAQFRDQVQQILKEKAHNKKKTGPKPKVKPGLATDHLVAATPFPVEAIPE